MSFKVRGRVPGAKWFKFWPRVNKFEIQFCHNVYSQTNTIMKGNDILIPTGFNSITAVLLNFGLDGFGIKLPSKFNYCSKQRNPTTIKFMNMKKKKHYTLFNMACIY